ncbi:hypothetical protein CYV32_16030 [Carnobacterium maltaromaticum]|nr:hypothetical protein CYV32_16030 [Carnobacterium maltaromaticum]
MLFGLMERLRVFLFQIKKMMKRSVYRRQLIIYQTKIQRSAISSDKYALLANISNYESVLKKYEATFL